MKDRWKQISEIYHAAQELTESERPAFLKAHVRDEEVRREVESLLAAGDKAADILESPAIEAVARKAAEESRASLIGRDLGPYRIISEIGRGGMGEVYQANDRKLGRDVAIKVLPREFTEDADRAARFQREARLLASLNHPNIASIHGLEESGETPFLVLELVKGETLSDRLKRGPIPVEEALETALQIAQALEAAHEKRVIHRDLKPANIKVTPEGKVKVLDFGLAKVLAGEPSGDSSNSLTQSTMATRPGVILGTAAYMSPEQVRGKDVDKRADIWAFGCVLYEMLTGCLAFPGEEVSDILSAVIRDEPDWANLPRGLSFRLRETIDRCLEKDPRNRYHDISDVRLDILKALSSDGEGPTQSAASAKRRWTLQRSVAAIALIAIIVGICVWHLKPTPEPGPRLPLHYSEILPEDQQMDDNILQGSVLAVSPDGRQFAYCANKGLYLRSLNDLMARRIPGSDDDPRSPFFSPDGQWVGYFSRNDGKLKKIEVKGGPPDVICEDVYQAIYGAEWGKDHTIIYGDGVRGIWRVSDNGGEAKLIVKGHLVFPQRIKDGESVLFTDVAPLPAYRIMTESLESGERKELLKGEWARYLPSGHLVFGNFGGWSETKTYVVPFDSKTLEKRGEPSFLNKVASRTLPAISNTGTLVYIPGGTTSADFLKVMVWMDRDGNEMEGALDQPQQYLARTLSPDNKQLAVAIMKDKNIDIYVWDFENKNWKQLTDDEGTDGGPIWTPNGDRIVFRSTRNEEDGIYWMAADGTGDVEKLVSIPNHQLYPYCWVSGGKELIFLAISPTTGEDIGILSMEDRKSKMLLHEAYYENSPHISPDSQFLAYASNESGQFEVYVRPYPDVSGVRYPISEGRGGQGPVWLRNGRELLYRNGDDVMIVGVNTEAGFTHQEPRVLFTSPYSGHWSISRDGNRFLLDKPYGPAEASSPQEFPRKIIVVTNWFEELKQRVPVD